MVEGQEAFHGHLVRGQMTGQLTLEDPEVVDGNLRECLDWNSKILGENIGRRVGEPIRHRPAVSRSVQEFLLRGRFFVGLVDPFAAGNGRSDPKHRRSDNRKVSQGQAVGDAGVTGRGERGSYREWAVSVSWLGSISRLSQIPRFIV